MYALGFLCLVASAVALPAPSSVRPSVIEYAVPLPMGYYAPPAPLLRTIVEDPKAEKGIVAAFPDAPALAPLDAPVIQEVLIENEPKKEHAPEKPADKKPADEMPASGKPEEGKPMTVRIEVARPPIVHRFSWPSWLPQLPQINLPFKFPEIPIISNVVSFLTPQIETPARVYAYPIAA